MTPAQHRHLQASFRRIDAAKRNVALTFYTLLLSRVPQLRARFPAEMGALRDALNDTLAAIAHAPGDLARLQVRLRAQAREHAALGVRPDHLAVAGEALLEALLRQSPSGLSAAERGAWAAALGEIGETLRPALAAECARLGAPARPPADALPGLA